MTMNTRQAGAFTEAIHKEERSRELWNRTHGQAYASQAQKRAAQELERTLQAQAVAQQQQQQQQQTIASTAPYGFGGANAQPVRARPQSARVAPAAATSVPYSSLPSPQEVYGNAYAVGTPRVIGLDEQLVDGSRGRIAQRVVRRTVEVPAGVRQVRVPVSGFRVDSVPVSKQVEVEELHTYQLDAQGREATPRVLATRELPGSERIVPFAGRQPGTTVYDAQDPALRLLPVDYADQSARQGTVSGKYWQQAAQQPSPIQRPQTARQTTNRGAPQPFAYSPQQFGSPQYAYPQQQPLQYPATSRQGVPSVPMMSQPPQSFQQPAPPTKLGFKIRASLSGAPGTCTVTDVDPQGLAARGGLRPGDILLSTNGQRTASLQDFRSIVAGSRGPILLQVKRGTERFVVTVQR